MSGKIKLTIKQILNLCEFAGIAITINKSAFTQELDYLKTEYVITQNKYNNIYLFKKIPKKKKYLSPFW